ESFRDRRDSGSAPSTCSYRLAARHRGAGEIRRPSWSGPAWHEANAQLARILGRLADETGAQRRALFAGTRDLEASVLPAVRVFDEDGDRANAFRHIVQHRWLARRVKDVLQAHRVVRSSSITR